MGGFIGLFPRSGMGWASAIETALDPPIYPRSVTHAKDGIATLTHAKEGVATLSHAKQGAGCITTDK